MKKPALILLACAVALTGIVLGYLYLTDFWEPKISLKNAKKVRAGLTDEQVVRILGDPTESEMVEIPDTGALMGSMLGGLLGGGREGAKAPPAKKAMVYVWKDGDKKITVLFIDRLVVERLTEGLGEEPTETAYLAQPKKGGSEKKPEPGKQPEQKDPPQKPAPPFYPFTSVVIMPIAPPEESSELVKGEISRLEQSLPLLIKEHSTVEVKPSGEGAKQKNADPVQVGRDAKAGAVLVVRSSWQRPRASFGVEYQCVTLTIELYDTQTSFCVYQRVAQFFPSCEPKERSRYAPEDFPLNMAKEAKKIVQDVKTAAEGMP